MSEAFPVLSAAGQAGHDAAYEAWPSRLTCGSGAAVAGLPRARFPAAWRGGAVSRHLPSKPAMVTVGIRRG